MTKVKKEIFAVDTSSRNLKEWVKALAILVLGLAILLLGAALMILANLGSDSFAVFNQGLAITFELSLGTIQFIFNFLVLIILLLTTKGYVKPGTVAITVLAGPFIDFYIWLLKDIINEKSPMIARMLGMLAGCVLLSIGISLLINSQAGAGANDIVAMVLSDKIQQIDYRWIKISYDFILVLIGYFLGGTVGIGTIVSVALMGPLIQFWLRKTRILTNFIMSKE